jgi:hypothetical protein
MNADLGELRENPESRVEGENGLDHSPPRHAPAHSSACLLFSLAYLAVLARDNPHAKARGEVRTRMSTDEHRFMRKSEEKIWDADERK